MSKSTRSNGRRSIKGLIPPVANTRRHRELISPNRGNKREAVASWRKIERPCREMDLPEPNGRWTVLRPQGRTSPSSLPKGATTICPSRKLQIGSQWEIGRGLWKGSELTWGWLRKCKAEPEGRFSDFGFSRCVKTITEKDRLFSFSLVSPLQHPFFKLLMTSGIKFLKIRTLEMLDFETKVSILLNFLHKDF